MNNEMNNEMMNEVELNDEALDQVAGGDYIQDFQGDFGDWLVYNPHGTYDQYNCEN